MADGSPKKPVRNARKSMVVRTGGPTKRLSPAARKSEILHAALRLLAKAGLKGFSLEAVAREAGVAASLPRHYFGGTYELMKAATEDVLKEVEDVLLGRKPGLTLSSRFASYLEILVRAPWGHEVWIRARELHPSLNLSVQKSRRRMMETMYGRSWKELSKREQIDGRGRVGYIEAIVSDWLEDGMKDSEIVLEALVRTATFQRVVDPAAVGIKKPRSKG